jgi:N-ethylmaleimide reductase
MTESLFRPLRMGALTLPNRVVMAPMTRNRVGAGNAPGPLNVEYYRQRAGAGLIVTESTQVSEQGAGYAWTPGIHSAAQIDGWRAVTAAVHAAGGRIFCQLWHGGRISHPSLQPGGALPVAPSAIAPSGKCMTYQGNQPFVTPRALATDEIPGLVAQFRDAARAAKDAGFDGVELHGASGYLLDQFIQDNANVRTDAYGGTLANRARLPLDCTRAAIEVWGEDRVGYRISPFMTFNDMKDSNPVETFLYLTSELSGLGIAYLHAVEVGAPAAEQGRHPLFRQMRARFDGVLMVNGGYTGESGNAVIAAGMADAVSYAKLYISNPDLPQRLRTGAALTEPARATFYGGDHRGYTDYPFMDPAAAG